jgi:DNA-binding transcriptional MerR regulator
MAQYSITSISRITGISPSTIRTWERRYGVPVASRSANGRRFYTDGEVERLKLIAALVRDGRPISDLTGLNVEQLRASERPNTASGAISAAYRDLINALETADLNLLRWGVSQAFLRLSVLDAVEKVISPMLRLLGQGWQDGRFTPGLEHAATAVTKQSIYAAAAMHGGSSSGKPVLFTTLYGERHELGLLLGWLLARTENANAIHLGVELSPDLIVEAAHLFGADLIVLFFVRDANTLTLGRVLRALDKALPHHIQVWLCADEAHPAHNLKSGRRFTPISAYGDFHRRIRLHAGA